METALPWIAAILIILAASLTASNLGARITGTGFIVFTLGSLAWLATGVIKDDMSLVGQNILLTLLNLFGVWRWLGREARFEQGGRHARRDSASADEPSLFPASLFSNGEVRSSDGHRIGQAVDALIECESGRVQAVIISDGGVAGVGEALRRVRWTDLEPDKSRLQASFSKRDFDRMTRVERDEWLHP